MSPVGWETWACMNCGALAVVCAITDEPRPHDVRLLGYEEWPLGDEVLGWLWQFPRHVGERAFASPDAQMCTPEELTGLAQSLTYGPLIRSFARAGVPQLPAPDGLPEALQGYVDVAAMVAEARTVDLDRWVGWAARPHTAFLALDYLALQPDAVDLIQARMAEGALQELGPVVLERLRALRN